MSGKKVVIAAIALTAAAVALQGCAIGSGRALDQKSEREGKVVDGRELQARARHLIQRSEWMRADQRADLDVVVAATGSQLAQIDAETLRLRAALLKSLFDGKDDDLEIAAIESRLKMLKRASVEAVSDAVDEAGRILDREKDQGYQIGGVWTDSR